MLYLINLGNGLGCLIILAVLFHYVCILLSIRNYIFQVNWQYRVNDKQVFLLFCHFLSSSCISFILRMNYLVQTVEGPSPAQQSAKEASQKVVDPNPTPLCLLRVVPQTQTPLLQHIVVILSPLHQTTKHQPV